MGKEFRIRIGGKGGEEYGLRPIENGKWSVSLPPETASELRLAVNHLQKIGKEMRGEEAGPLRVQTGK